MKRALLIACAGALAAAGWWQAGLPLPGARRPPNVILIAVDTLRADALSCLGGPPDATPALDQFAAGATVFTDATAPACWTLPSLASLFTGLYPSAHGAIAVDRRLPAGFVTLAELLRQHGYRTAAFTSGGYVTSAFGLNQGFDVFDSRTETGHFVDRVPLAEQWLAGADAPFFLFVHGYDVHSPYSPAERPPKSEGFVKNVGDRIAEFGARVAAGADVKDLGTGAIVAAYLSVLPPGPDSAEQLQLLREAYVRYAAGLTEPIEDLWARDPHFGAQLAWVKALYAAEVRETDRQLRRFLRGLEQAGRFDDSIIVVLADHGEAFMEHGHFEHSHVEQEVARIPLLVHLPPHLRRAAPARVEAPVSGVDLLPTLADYCGAPIPTAAMGQSLRPALEGGALDDVPICCFQQALPGGGEEVAVRRGRWKWIEGGRRGAHALPDRLFDLAADPGETLDLAALQPEVLDGLRAALAAVRADCERARGAYSGEAAALDAEALKDLARLGYLGQLRDRAPTEEQR